MARAEAASASARPDSIKGLAESIARPAYRRLLSAEPALRRAVPVLIVAFLVSVGIGAVIQAFAHRNQVIADAVQDIELIAEILSIAWIKRRATPRATFRFRSNARSSAACRASSRPRADGSW